MSFVDRYGAVRLGQFLYVFNPFTKVTGMNLVSEMDSQSEILATSEIAASGRVPVFPAPGGLLAWGRSDNGDCLTWRTSGTPDEWPVMVIDRDGVLADEVASGAVGFLEAVLGGTHRGPIFPDDFP